MIKILNAIHLLLFFTMVHNVWALNAAKVDALKSWNNAGFVAF